MSRIAILAGSGHLPVALSEADPEAFVVSFKGMATSSNPDLTVQFEHLGALFECLKQEGVARVVMAGGMSRPVFDPAAMDAFTQELAPALGAAMAGGDDTLLRFIIKMFEDQGFRVVGAHSLLPELTATEGMIAGAFDPNLHEADIQRADMILGTLSPVDVGQAVVVEGGICLGIETIQGTDALLEFVAATKPHLRRGRGVLVKRPKVGQDLRVDMPAIGPATVQNVAQAGLAGIVISPGRVLLLDREKTLQAARDAGVFIAARRHA